MDPLQMLMKQSEAKTIERYDEEKYEDCYVVFLDILGMKNLVEEGFETLRNVFVAIEGNLDIYKNAGIIGTPNRFIDQDQVRLTIMSDSIVFSARKDVEHAFSKLIGVSSSVISKLLSVEPNPVFIRGGISRGKVYHQNSIVFGPGLTKAYSLENEEAKYMRCILDKSLLDEPEIQKYMAKTDVFVKYEDDYLFINFIKENNRERVLSFAQKCFQKNYPEGIKKKYEWLINFINR